MSNIFQRNLKKGNLTWYARFRAPDPDRHGRTKDNVRCTFTTDPKIAAARLKAMVDAANAGRFDLLDLAKARRAPSTTLAQLFTLYRAGTAHSIKEQTALSNINALGNLIRRAWGRDTKVETLTIADLTPDMMWKWKEAVAATIAAESATDLDGQRLARSANSILRMAKSIFTREMLIYYERQGKIKIPEALRQFIAEPPLRNAGKIDYYPPTDITIQKTFEALEKIRDTDRNLYLAVWMALGFGLRKGEIASAKVGSIIQRSGVTYFRGADLSKNGTLPDVTVQLGAWSKLQPLLAGRAEQEHILTGTATERTEETFRRVSIWMRTLGWETQKTIHEFRAYAGCKVAEVHGLLAARQWMRHSSSATTEKYYGRYIRMRIPEVPMPTLTDPGPFVPKVVGEH